MCIHHSSVIDLVAVVEKLFWQLGRVLEAVSVVRFTEIKIVRVNSMDGLSAGTKQNGRRRQLAVSGGSTVPAC